MRYLKRIHKPIRRMAAWLVIGSCALSFPVYAEEVDFQGECTPEEEAYIWQFLLDLTGNPKAAAGIMGNLCYESHLQTNKMEKGNKLGYTDEDYTAAVDSGEYDSFAEDGCGYGLAQWSYSSRKQRLWELALSSNASVSDLDVQLQLIAEELEKYNMLYRISHTDSVQFASDYFLLNFENSQVQDEEMKKLRGELSFACYEKYAEGMGETEISDAREDAVQAASDSTVPPAEPGGEGSEMTAPTTEDFG